MAQLRAVIDRVRTIKLLTVLFVVSYAVLSAAGVPASPLTLAGGALFGTKLGIPLNWLGAFGGAILAYGATRALAGSRRGSLTDAATQTQALRTSGAPLVLFRLRLVPIVPFSLLNVGAALSGMRWSSYLWATGLGIIPIVVIYTVFSASLVAGVENGGRRALMTAMFAAVVITALTVIPRMIRPKKSD